jgi:uncharacterized protein YihD (DUF1040 family)
MRDPQRIDRILRLIRQLWMTYPDLRLGQLLFNFAGFTNGDSFHIEDDLIEAKLMQTASMVKEH